MCSNIILYCNCSRSQSSGGSDCLQLRVVQPDSQSYPGPILSWIRFCHCWLSILYGSDGGSVQQSFGSHSPSEFFRSLFIELESTAKSLFGLGNQVDRCLRHSLFLLSSLFPQWFPPPLVFTHQMQREYQDPIVYNLAYKQYLHKRNLNALSCMCIVSSGLLDGNIDHLGECEPSGGSNLCFLHLRKVRNLVTFRPGSPFPRPVFYSYHFSLSSIGALRSVHEKSAVPSTNPILERLDRHPASSASKERNENHFFFPSSHFVYLVTDKGQRG